MPLTLLLSSDPHPGGQCALDRCGDIWADDVVITPDSRANTRPQIRGPRAEVLCQGIHCGWDHARNKPTPTGVGQRHDVVAWVDHKDGNAVSKAQQEGNAHLRCDQGIGIWNNAPTIAPAHDPDAGSMDLVGTDHL